MNPSVERIWTKLRRVLFFPLVPVRRRRSFLASMLIDLLVLFVVLYLGLCLFALFFAKGMIFPAPATSYTENELIFKLPLREGEEVAALYLPNPEAEFTLLYSHGNGEDLGYSLPLLRDFQEKGFAVMAYDYPGYGLSDGKPSESGSLQAAAAAFTYLVTLKDTDPGKIILYGRSLGSGPSYYLASRKVVAGMIIDGGFSSTFRVMTRRRILPWDIFDNVARAAEVRCPVLLIHGKQDATVPFSHAAFMAKRLPGRVETLFIEEAGHNNLIELASEDYWDAILNFKNSLPK